MCVFITAVPITKLFAIVLLTAFVHSTVEQSGEDDGTRSLARIRTMYQTFEEEEERVDMPEFGRRITFIEEEDVFSLCP